MNKREEARLDELDLYTIFLHGGWWMTKQTLKPYLDWMKDCKATMLIAEITKSNDKSEIGKIVGHLDLWPGWEPQPFNQHTFIDVIEVNARYQKRGIGSALIKHAIKISQNWNASMIITVPEEESFNFYFKNSFEIFQEYWYFKGKTFKTEVDELLEVKEVKTTEYSEVKNLILVSRPLADASAYHIWMRLQMGKYDFPSKVRDFKPLILKRISIEDKENTFEGVVWIEEDGNFIYWITSSEYLDPKSNYEILKAIILMAYQENIKILSTWTPVELTYVYEKLKFKKEGREVIVSRRI